MAHDSRRGIGENNRLRRERVLAASGTTSTQRCAVCSHRGNHRTSKKTPCHTTPKEPRLREKWAALARTVLSPSPRPRRRAARRAAHRDWCPAIRSYSSLLNGTIFRRYCCGLAMRPNLQSRRRYCGYYCLAVRSNSSRCCCCSGLAMRLLRLFYLAVVRPIAATAVTFVLQIACPSRHMRDSLARNTKKYSLLNSKNPLPSTKKLKNTVS